MSAAESLHWGRWIAVWMLRFNEAAACQLRNPRCSGKERSSLCCFNEAAACQLRNLPARTWLGLSSEDASMRPQRVSCGILLDAVGPIGHQRASMRPQRVSCGIADNLMVEGFCVGASMRPQRVSCGICEASGIEHRDVPRFNEAAACQLRNRVSTDDDVLRMLELQ